jgi:hypothetical protein
MTKQEEYVENAVESLELAERLASSSDRHRMLKLAEAMGGTCQIERTVRAPLVVEYVVVLLSGER